MIILVEYFVAHTIHNECCFIFGNLGLFHLSQSTGIPNTLIVCEVVINVTYTTMNSEPNIYSFQNFNILP